jgi:hypothetical protein
MNWTSLLTNYGLGVLVLFAIGWFIACRIWPFYKEQVKANQESREKMLTGFQDSLRYRDAEFGKIVSALQELTDELRGRRPRK